MLMRRHAAICLFLSGFLTWHAASAQPLKVTVSESSSDVVVDVHDLDLLRAKHARLRARVTLEGIGRTYDASLAEGRHGPAILIRKAAAQPCGAVTVTLHDGAAELFKQQWPTPAQVRIVPRVPLTDATAFIIPGDDPGLSPVIRQPDLTKLQAMQPGSATRTIEAGAITARVEADISFPEISANNNIAMSRQTAHPDDPNLRSCYIPMRSMVYDPQTGKSLYQANYLTEIPLDPAWLEGSDDRTITLTPDVIRVHSSTKRLPAEGGRGSHITGEGNGGLGQMAYGMSVDDAGNLYYSASVPNSVVRFNIRTCEFETPAVNLQELMQSYMTMGDVPEHLKGKKPIFDSITMVGVSGGRMYLVPVRYLDLASPTAPVRYNGVFSFPLEHWDDAEKFRATTRFVAGSWPGSPMALYDFWPHAGKRGGQLAPGNVINGCYYLSSYSSGIEGGPWCIELNPDGSSKSIRQITYDDIEKARRGSDPKLPINGSGFLNWSAYGVLTATREKLSGLLPGLLGLDRPKDHKPQGSLTINYDAIAAMRIHPERHADILSAQRGPSRAPCYMMVGIPGKPGHLLGVGEYGYYLAEFDVTKASTGVISKQYLASDAGEGNTFLPVRVGLGPYGRLWWRDGAKLYFVATGYTGIASMLYRDGDQALTRFRSIASAPPNRSLDHSPTGSYKWEKSPIIGLDNRIYLAGASVVDRGGSPYSNGLGVFTPPTPTEVGRLTRMSRGGSSGTLLMRIVHEADGRAVQQFFLAGGMSKEAYLEAMKDEEKPECRDSKELVYQCVPGEEPRNLIGFSLPVINGESSLTSQVISRDGRYLITLQQGCLLSFDLEGWRYVDGRKLEAELWISTNPDQLFIRSPDGRILVCVQNADGTRAEFQELIVSPGGELSLEPYLAVHGESAALLTPYRYGVLTFTPDASGDGSYDLCMGPSPRAVSSEMWVIPDFIQPRIKLP